MENSIRNTDENKANYDSSKSIFNGVGKIEKLFESGTPLKLMPKILFGSFIMILYIMNSYLIEKKRIGIQKIKADIEDLRTDYTTLKADYMINSKQSEVAKRVEKLGLSESKTSPIRLIIHKNKN